MKYKNGITIANAFEQILDESNRKSDKIWVYKGRELYNTSMKSWLQDNDIAMYSKHNERNTVVAETVMTSVSKHVYIDKLDEIVNKYNNTYHSTIKIKPVVVIVAYIATLIRKMNILVRFFGGSVTLGGGVEDSAFPYLQLSSQKKNNNQKWRKYSLYKYKHFGIKIYVVTSYISR